MIKLNKFNSFLLICGLTFCSSCSLKRDDSPKRTYIYFSNYLKASEATSYSIKVDFESWDGKKESGEYKEIKSNGIYHNIWDNNSYFWVCDAPAFAKGATLQLLYFDTEYCKLELTKMDSVCFNWSAKGYSLSQINPDAGWMKSKLNPEQFCDYVLSRIDPNSSSYLDGYNSYLDINDTFISSFDRTDLNTLYSISWNDSYLQKEVTAQEKINLIKDNYNKNNNVTYVKPVLIYVFGTLLLFVLAFISLLILLPEFRNKVKNKFHFKGEKK